MNVVSLLALLLGAEPVPDAVPAATAMPATATATATPTSTAPARQILHLVDGTTLRGELVSSTADAVVFATSLGTFTIPKSSITRAEMDIGLPATTVTTLPAPTPRAVATPTPAATTRLPARGVYDLRLIAGAKRLSNDWRPVQNQPALGAELTFGRADWIGGIAVDGATTWWSRKGDTVETAKIEYTGQTTEIAIGARAMIPVGRFRPYAGAGFSRITARFAGENPRYNAAAGSGSATGPWLGVGCFTRLGGRWNVGVAFRYSQARIELFGKTGDAGGVHAGFSVGFGNSEARREP